jgi:hypothetical protein
MARSLLFAGLLAAILTAASPSLADPRSAPVDPETTGAIGLDPRLAHTQRENTAALMQEWAEDLAYALLDAWSSDNRVALNGLADLYAARVSFFGRLVDRLEVQREKRRFAARWPVRRYEHRPRTMAIDCDVEAKICHVRSTIDWRAENPARQTRSRGAAKFELGVSFAGDQPLVAYEGGRVTRVSSAD